MMILRECEKQFKEKSIITEQSNSQEIASGNSEESYAKEPMDYQGISDDPIENNLGGIRWNDEVAVEKGLQASGAEEIIGGVVIHRIYKYLQKEYEDLKALNASSRCDLTPLANILKRTAEATGVSELVVTAVVIAHGSNKEPPPDEILSEHNYYRRQSKREDVVTLKVKIAEESINEGDSKKCSRADVSRGNVGELTLKCEVFNKKKYVLPKTSPPVPKISKTSTERQRDYKGRLKEKQNKLREELQNVKILKRKSATEYKRKYRMRQKYNKMNAQVIPRPETTPPVAPPCQISKTPPEQQHDDSVCLKQIKIEPPEGEQTEQESIKSSPAKHQRGYSTRQKYNEMNARAVQSLECMNRDDVKMEIEEYTFILFEPSDESTTDDPMGVNIKVEPQEYS